MSKNSYSDNLTDIAAYGSEATTYILDEIGIGRMNNGNADVTVANGGAAQQYYDQYQAQYGLDLSAACQ